ncbi:MAG: MazG nucleotide pyrophosphohydrolase domain-containing protein [Planctomycetota bacterium]
MSSPELPNQNLTISAFQQLIRDRYFETDNARGTHATFLLLTEEFGELATALYNCNKEVHGGSPPTDEERANLAEEFADVFAWMLTLASINGVDLAKACEKYTDPERVKGTKE